MSIYVIKWVLEESGEKPVPRMVLFSLAYHAAKDGTNAYPSVKTIMAETGLSHGTVHDALKGLEKRGLIERTGRRRHGTIVYSVTMEGVREPDSSTDVQVSESWTPAPPLDTVEVSEKRTRGVRELDSEGPGAGHEPSSNPSSNPPTSTSLDTCEDESSLRREASEVVA